MIGMHIMRYLLDDDVLLFYFRVNRRAFFYLLMIIGKIDVDFFNEIKLN